MDSEIHGPAATAERRYSQNNLDKTKKGEHLIRACMGVV